MRVVCGDLSCASPLAAEVGHGSSMTLGAADVKSTSGIRAPTPIVIVAPGTLQWAIFPPQGVDVGLTLFCAAKLVDIGEKRHEEESPGS